MLSGKNTHFALSHTITDIYIGIMIFAYLLYPGFKGYSGITEQKTIIYYCLTIPYIALCTFFSLNSIRSDSTHTSIRHLNAVQKMMLLYLLMTLVSAILSEFKENAFFGGARCEGFFTIALYVLSFVLISSNYIPKKWHLILFGISISLSALLSVIQFLGKNPLRLYPTGMNYYDAGKLYSGEFLGTIGNVDLLGSVLALAIALFFAALLISDNKNKYFTLIPLSLSLIILLKSFVAGGIVGALGGIIISIPCLCNNKKTKIILWFVLIIIIIIGLIVVYFYGDKIGGFIKEASEIMHGNVDDDFGSGRIYIWRNVIKLFPQKPLFGGGPETLVLRTDAFFERFDENLNVLIHSSIDTAHNEYLNFLVNQGVFALLFYCFALFFVIKEYIIKASSNPTLAIWGTGCIAYMISAFFGISVPISAPFFWIALAISASTISSKRYKNKSK